VAALPTPKDIEAVARDVLRELTGEAGPPGAPRAPARQLVAQGEVRAAADRGEKTLVVPAGAIVTPLARDLAWDLGVEFRHGGAPAGGAPAPARAAEGPTAGAELAPLDAGGGVALGSDHGGFRLKQALAAHLRGRGVEVFDLGAHGEESCDYPDFAAAVAGAVALGEVRWGVVADGAGIGSCMAANKVPGVLAATCHDERTAVNSREHNGANVLCLGAGSLDEAAARRVVDAWLQTAFGGGRHARRVGKIQAIERSFVR